MGNNHPRPVRFRQSANDFPLTVSLGEKAPSWGLSRWDGGGLRFIPPDDEGFTLQGDKRRLVYKGRRRSHRFTILSGTAFEYDCILEREPDSNVISLLIEGAERFDFFRQPDFIQDPLLAGSYAVYKKETLPGEGTGKLCHIHRPEIIDARGRRCWGELSVADNRLCITIPEHFLSAAAYPVVVDPTIGTTTVGSQYLWDNNDPGEPLIPLFLNVQIGVNRFPVNETLDGTCTAYIYTSDDDPDAAGRPVIYSDNGNTPLSRKSKNESLIDFRVTSSKPKGWRSGTFQTNESITKGSYIWFGVFAEYFLYPRFDYGTRCYRDFWDDYDSIPDTYPVYNVLYYEDHKLSMYFTYSSAQNYVRTLTQGVRLTDSRKTNTNYKRAAAQTVKGTTAFTRTATFPRKCLMTLSTTVNLICSKSVFSYINESVLALMGIVKNQSLSRNCTDEVKAGTSTKRIQELYRQAQDTVTGNEYFTSPVLFMRVLPETAGISDAIRQLASFIRGIREEARSIAETSRTGEYYREQTEAVRAESTVFRGFLIFIQILTVSLVRDFLLRRFIKSNDELVLKSCICRTITLDSSIQ